MADLDRPGQQCSSGVVLNMERIIGLAVLGSFGRRGLVVLGEGEVGVDTTRSVFVAYSCR